MSSGGIKRYRWHKMGETLMIKLCCNYVMGVFYFFKILQMVPNCAKCLIYQGLFY